TKNERINLELNKQIKELKLHYDLTMDYFVNDVQSIRVLIQNHKKIIEVFSKAKNSNKEERVILRKELYKLLIPRYNRLKIRGILQLQFVFPNNNSFLRMHKPSKYGDNIADIRYSFKYTNSTKKEIVGFEQGRTTHAFRYVFPLFKEFNKNLTDKNNYLGAVEISLASYAIQEKLLSVNKIHSHFLVNKDIFNVKTWEAKDLIQKYIPSIEHNDYMFALTKHTNNDQLQHTKINIINPLKKEISKKMSLKRSFALYVEDKNTIKVISFLPIKDTLKNDVAAYIVAYTNNDNIYNLIKYYKYSNIIIFIVMVFLFYFIYKNLTYKKELEIEVEKKTQSLNKISEDLKEINENLEYRIKEEVGKSKEIEKKLFQSKKMAQMGEMIGAIAHQWRQPLNAISLSIQNLKYDFKANKIDEEFIGNYIVKNKKTINFMSKTIDDFRNFFRTDKNMIDFSIKQAIEDTVSIQWAQLNSVNINLSIEGDDFTIHGFKSEFQQVVLNLISNAKDAIVENNIDNGNIVIQLNYGSITICDNAGGIPIDIIDRVFEPYYTTKAQGKGTGMGLYMSKMIIDNMNSNIGVSNTDNGACFVINFLKEKKSGK
ncbi:MAG: hypothetical protein KAJ49_07440, partial [Arcobacteraceae bacterium]|nr:hypothetical protein [Arcobacteraceae bacterium]